MVFRLVLMVPFIWDILPVTPGDCMPDYNGNIGINCKEETFPSDPSNPNSVPPKRSNNDYDDYYYNDNLEPSKSNPKPTPFPNQPTTPENPWKETTIGEYENWEFPPSPRPWENDKPVEPTCSIQCSDPPCNWIDGTSPTSELASLANRPFETKSGRTFNVLTGVRGGKSGPSDKYLVAGMRPGDYSGLDSGPLKLAEPRVLQFDAYEVTNGMVLKVCLDFLIEPACQTITKNKAQRDLADRRWTTYKVLLPAGTSRIFFLSDNNSDNHGVTALDNIKLLLPCVTDPSNTGCATLPAC